MLQTNLGIPFRWKMVKIFRWCALIPQRNPGSHLKDSRTSLMMALARGAWVGVYPRILPRPLLCIGPLKKEQFVLR